MRDYEPFDWFWIVGGDESRAWSSAAGAYVETWPADGVTRILSEEELTDVLRRYRLPGPVAMVEDVNLERTRRMATFPFAGHIFGLREDKGELANVSGAGTLALAAIFNGATPGDLRWADPDTDFTWIADDNTVIPMDAQTTWAFAQTAAAWRKKTIYCARVLKDMSPIPSDYATNEAYWS